jgi:uncharacterized membrane protein HdeD (DUF308 family)
VKAIKAAIGDLLLIVGIFFVLAAFREGYLLIGLTLAFGYPDWNRVGLSLAVCVGSVIGGVLLIRNGWRQRKTETFRVRKI